MEYSVTVTERIVRRDDLIKIMNKREMVCDFLLPTAKQAAKVLTVFAVRVKYLY